MVNSKCENSLSPFWDPKDPFNRGPSLGSEDFEVFWGLLRVDLRVRGTPIDDDIDDEVSRDWDWIWESEAIECERDRC